MKSHSNASLIPRWRALRNIIGSIQALTILFAACVACQGATLVNADLTGFASGGGGLSESFVVSGDGRLVAFSSSGTNLVAGDTNNISDIFVRDWAHRSNVWDTTYSLAPSSGGLASVPLDFTPDGRFLLFSSPATNLVSGVSFPIATLQLFVRDLRSNVTAVVSVSADGLVAGPNGQFNTQGGLGAPRITPDGRFVAFVSAATNLVSLSDTNQAYDVFCRDMVSGVTELITVSLNGTAALARQTIPYCMSTNGRYFAFETASPEVVPGLTNTNQFASQVYRRDREAGTNAAVSLTLDGTFPQASASLRDMSSDGRYICFSVNATNMAPNQNDNNGTLDIFIRDMALGETWLVTRATNGMTTGSRNSGGRFSADGSSLLFATTVADLVPGIADINTSSPDLFVHDVATRSNDLVTISHDGRSGADDGVSDIFARISASGRFVLFSATATNLLAGTTNHVQRLFLRDRKAGITVNPLRADYPTPPFNGARFAFSPSERYIFFPAYGAFDPHIPDTNPGADLFANPLYPPKFGPVHLGAALSAEGISGEKYVLERSIDLLSWTVVNTNTADARGQLNLIDPQATSSLHRFYRLRWP